MRYCVDVPGTAGACVTVRVMGADDGHALHEVSGTLELPADHPWRDDEKIRGADGPAFIQAARAPGQGPIFTHTVHVEAERIVRAAEDMFDRIRALARAVRRAAGKLVARPSARVCRRNLARSFDACV